MRESMLTTTDNPHDPFTDFDSWLAFDTRLGYHTTSYLARVAAISEELSEADYNLAIDSAIDEIMEYNVNGMYKKVSREVAQI